MTDLSTLSTVELKALAYDAISDIERSKINLQAINREIGTRLAEEARAQEMPQQSPESPQQFE